MGSQECFIHETLSRLSVGIASVESELGKRSLSCDVMDQKGHDMEKRFANRQASDLAQ